jgi:hypothetical protein
LLFVKCICPDINMMVVTLAARRSVPRLSIVDFVDGTSAAHGKLFMPRVGLVVIVYVSTTSSDEQFCTREGREKIS